MHVDVAHLDHALGQTLVSGWTQPPGWRACALRPPSSRAQMLREGLLSCSQRSEPL